MDHVVKEFCQQSTALWTLCGMLYDSAWANGKNIKISVSCTIHRSAPFCTGRDRGIAPRFLLQSFLISSPNLAVFEALIILHNGHECNRPIHTTDPSTWNFLHGWGWKYAISDLTGFRILSSDILGAPFIFRVFQRNWRYFKFSFTFGQWDATPNTLIIRCTIDRTWDDSRDVWLGFESVCFSKSLAKDCLGRKAFLCYKCERSSIPYISNISSHVSQCPQSGGQLTGWLITRDNNHNTPAGQLLEESAQMSSGIFVHKGVETALLELRASERINTDHVHTAKIGKWSWSIPSCFQHNKSVQPDVAESCCAIYISAVGFYVDRTVCWNYTMVKPCTNSCHT